MVGLVLRGSRLPIACCAALTVAVVVGGCAKVVAGTARAGDPQVVPARPIPVADLLIEPSRFPAQYPAAALPPKDVDRVFDEIDGVPVGFEVTPPECAPLSVLAQQRAAVQGTDDETGSRLIVTVARPVPSIRARVTQLTDCPTFTSTAGGEAGAGSEGAAHPARPPPADAGGRKTVRHNPTAEAGAP